MWYLPIPFGIALIFWWGPWVLLPLYLNAMFSASLWGLDRLALAPLYAWPEVLAVFLAWFFYIRLSKGQLQPTRLRDSIRYFFLACLIPVFIGGFSVQGQLILLGDLKAEDFFRVALPAFTSDLLGVTVITTGMLLILSAHVPWRIRRKQDHAPIPCKAFSIPLKNWGFIEPSLFFILTILTLLFLPIDSSWPLLLLYFTLMALRQSLYINIFNTSVVILTALYLPNLLQVSALSWLSVESLDIRLTIIIVSNYIISCAMEDLRIEIKARTKAESLLNDQRRSLSHQVQDQTKSLQEKNMDLSNSLDELKRTQEKLIEAERFAAVGEMVAGVSHEVNTPLGVAITALSFLRAKLESLEMEIKENKSLGECREGIDIIENNLQRVRVLLLSLKKVSVNQLYEKKETFYLKKEIVTCLDLMGPMIRKNNIQLQSHLPEKDFQVHAQAQVIYQIISNLIMNAIHHGFSQTKSKFITVSLENREKTIYLSVMDNGSGIDPSIKNKVFEPFFTTRRIEGGSGLGLYIVRKLVENSLGGKIVIEDSSYVSGCRIVVSIPMS